MDPEEADWKACVDWLQRLHLLLEDHPALQPDATVAHLVQALIDGVLLCHLLTVLSDGAIDPRSYKDFNPRTQSSQFLCCKNIRLFTQICNEIFGIAKADLFEPMELYEAKNFGKVIHLLSLLSNSTIAEVNKTVPGFMTSKLPVTPAHDYYNDLENIADHMDKSKLDSDEIYDQMEEENQKNIYDTVVHKGKKNRYSSASEPTTAREHCIKEIVDTEKNYVEMLRMLIDNYKKPLANVLSSQELEEIFLYIEKLHEIHRELQMDLNVAVRSHVSMMTIHEAFLKAHDKLLVYGQYCSHLQTAQTLVMDISKHDNEKRSMIELCQSKSTNYSKFHLTELLTVPMQRVLKYHLLLDNLCKLTADGHVEKEGLQKTREAMRDLATSINEVKRDLETITAIDQIQASMMQIDLPPDRKLTDYGRRQMDGELKFQPSSEGRPKHRHVFLFDKMLLLSKAKGDNYIFKEAFHVASNRVEPISFSTKKGEKWSNGFAIQAAGESDLTHRINFYAKSEDLRDSWIRAFQEAVSNLWPNGHRANGYQFEMTTFPGPTYCNICDKLMRGMFFQGYRCRESKLVAHKECIRDAPPLTNGAHAPQRRSAGPMALPVATAGVAYTRRESLPATPGRMSLGSVKAIQPYCGMPLPSHSHGRYPLVFSVNEVIDLLNVEDPVWWEGRCQGREGWFPASHVIEHRNSRGPSRETSYLSGSSGTPLTPGFGLSHSTSMQESSPRSATSANGRFSRSRLTQMNSFSSLADLSDYPWYVGEMDRNQAYSELQGYPDGTFLVRMSKNVERMGEYAITVVSAQPKHIRIDRKGEQYFLSDAQYFSSIAALIEFYSTRSLSHCFPNLNTCLKLPYRQAVRLSTGSLSDQNPIFYATAQFDFSPETDKQLELRRGDRIAVISLAGCDRGWWKGRFNGRVGFFPRGYVVRDT